MPKASTRTTSANKRRYQPVNLLEIPREIEDHFAKKGFKLRWVRAKIKGEDDTKSLVTRLKEGFEFVKQEDIPVAYRNDYEIGSGRTEGSIVNADVVLMKIPVELAEDRQAYFEDMANDQLDAVNRQLQRNSSRDMPIHNESSTRTTTGRKPAEFSAITESNEED